MKLSKFGIAIAMAAVALYATSASAKVYDFTFTDNSNTLVASGSITTGPATVNDSTGQTVFAVLSGSGSLLGVDGFTADTISLYGTYSAPTSYSVIPDGSQTFDNALFDGVPKVDGNGLEFLGTSGSFLNVYNNVNTGAYDAGNYPNNDIIWNNAGNTVAGTFSVTAVPEPATWALFFLGFGAIGWTLRGSRNRRSALAV